MNSMEVQDFVEIIILPDEYALDVLTALKTADKKVSTILGFKLLMRRYYWFTLNLMQTSLADVEQSCCQLFDIVKAGILPPADPVQYSAFFGYYMRARGLENSPEVREYVPLYFRKE